ncbi:MAG TPA: 2-phospho-L-lactate guanylyltransferase [Actinomycetota bacterium]|jgi:2-phospho-L-lactate guanylyltransferase
MDAALIPVKELTRAKSRLAGDFDDAARLEIARALLDDALGLALSAPFFTWWVVTADAEVAGAAGARGLRTTADPGGGLNTALDAGIAAAAAEGATSVTIVPCDVPLAFRGDLEDLRDTGATSDVVLVPSGDDGGTNALYLSPPGLVTPRFGEGSLKSHLAAAEERGVRCSILALPRLALDIDTVEDVDAFLAWPRRFPSRTGDVLERLRPA